jgi:hypothetical protein
MKSEKEKEFTRLDENLGCGAVVVFLFLVSLVIMICSLIF